MHSKVATSNKCDIGPTEKVTVGMAMGSTLLWMYSRPKRVVNSAAQSLTTLKRKKCQDGRSQDQPQSKRMPLRIPFVCPPHHLEQCHGRKQELEIHKTKCLKFSCYSSHSLVEQHKVTRTSQNQKTAVPTADSRSKVVSDNILRNNQRFRPNV